MDERINILIGSDINYAPYYGVMLTSLFMNNKESKFDVFLLTDETWTETETKKFEKLCNQYDSTFYIKVVDINVLKKFPMTAHITLPTYYRLQACKLLPDIIHKILYLDGDMIVNGDIRPLWNTNLEGYAFAGSEDMDSVHMNCFERLGYDSKYGYFNAGVSLYNFDYWRTNNISEQLMKVISEQPDRMKWMDQDAVNFLLHNKRVRLPKRYNFQSYYLNHQWWDAYLEEEKQDIIKECQQAVIIHYNGLLKPWNYRYLGYPFAKLWRYYNKQSLWKINVNTPRIKYYKQWVKRIFFPSKAYANRNKDVIREYWDFM